MDTPDHRAARTISATPTAAPARGRGRSLRFRGKAGTEARPTGKSRRFRVGRASVPASESLLLHATRSRIVLDPKAEGAGDGVSPVAQVVPRDSSDRQGRESGQLEVPWKTRIAIVPEK